MKKLFLIEYDTGIAELVKIYAQETLHCLVFRVNSYEDAMDIVLNEAYRPDLIVMGVSPRAVPPARALLTTIQDAYRGVPEIVVVTGSPFVHAHFAAIPGVTAIDMLEMPDKLGALCA